MLLTIITPIFNRAKYLFRLYKSLSEQEYKYFEWLIIDDGSTENIDSFLSNNLESLEKLEKMEKAINSLQEKYNSDFSEAKDSITNSMKHIKDVF